MLLLEGKIVAIKTPVKAINLIDTDVDDKATENATPGSSITSAIRAGVVENLEICAIQKLMPVLKDKGQELSEQLDSIGPVDANQEQVASLRVELGRLQNRQASLIHQLDVFTHQHANGQCHGPGAVRDRIRRSGLHRASPYPGYVQRAPSQEPSKNGRN
jgi:hypothetical protein